MKIKRMTVSWILLLVHNLNFIFWGLFWILKPERIFTDAFSAYAGRSWIELRQSDHALAQLVEYYGRFLGIHGIIIAIILTFICFTAYRQRERWSWIAILIGSTLGWFSAMAMDFIMKTPAIVWVDILPLALVYASLAISARDVFTSTS